MTLSLWSVNPVWQNFSSLYRESQSANEAPTDMEKSHHLTASLYFGIATLEAFLNNQMRTHLKHTKTEHEIFHVLRNGRFMKKLEKWPEQILGKPHALNNEALDLLKLCNDVRGDLTHPKTTGQDIYQCLFKVEPLSVVDAVAQYVVSFHASQGTRYPYWIFGWNYLNPRPNTHEIMLFNDQQFCYSLAALGFNVPFADYGRTETWKDKYLRTVEGYSVIRDALLHTVGCEPKFDRFPFQPKLCRRWWTEEHQNSCGHVSNESLEAAKRIDQAKQRR
jgi:hypothetical protein